VSLPLQLLCILLSVYFCSTNVPASHTHNTGAIVGGVLGGVAFIVVVSAALRVFVVRRRKERTRQFRELIPFGGGDKPNIPLEIMPGKS
jgi:uncharacterized protein (DUF2062 family)